MSKLIIALLFLSLFACTNPNAVNVAKAKYLCMERGGIKHWYKVSTYPVVCADGTKISIDTLNGTIIPKKHLEEAYK